MKTTCQLLLGIDLLVDNYYALLAVLTRDGFDQSRPSPMQH